MLWGSESAEAVPDGRRERKKSRTRQDLVEAATKLFAAQGFSNTTVEQITELADVSVRTFFRHFDSKEEVLFPQRYHTDALLSAVAGQPEASSDLRAIRDAFIGLLTFDEAGLQRALLFRKAVRSDPALEGRELGVRRQFHRYLALAVARRHGLDESDEVAEMVAALAQSVIALAFDQWADSDGQADLEKLLSRKFDLADRIVSAEGSAEHPAGPRSTTLRRGVARARHGAGLTLVMRRLLPVSRTTGWHSQLAPIGACGAGPGVLAGDFQRWHSGDMCLPIAVMGIGRYGSTPGPTVRSIHEQARLSGLRRGQSPVRDRGGLHPAPPVAVPGIV